jgi:hypothetical protein
MASVGELQLTIATKPCLGSMKHQFCWTPGTRFQLGGPLSYDFIAQKVFVRGSPELGFSSVRHNARAEGRYNRVMYYHFKLLNHFTGREHINMPYFLHKTLTKMARQVKA